MSKKPYVLPSDKQAANNISVLTKNVEAELELCGILLPGVSIEREAWLDTFYRIRIENERHAETTVVIPGKLFKNIKDCVGKAVKIQGKLLSKNDGKNMELYIMTKAATPLKKEIFKNEVAMEGFALSEPEIRRGGAHFPVMLPHYSGIHNVVSCYCDAELVKNKDIKYGVGLKVFGSLVVRVKGYEVVATKVS